MDKIYDLVKVREYAGNDESFVPIVVEAFLKEIPEDLESMKVAIDNDNNRMAYQFAHKMKPNLNIFGLNLDKPIAAMEKWGETTKPPSAIKTQLDTIVKTIEKAIKELKRDFNM